MSLSAIRVKPSIDEPSNQTPLLTASSISPLGMVTFLTMPITSVNCMLTNSTLSSLIQDRSSNTLGSVRPRCLVSVLVTGTSLPLRPRGLYLGPCPPTRERLLACLQCTPEQGRVIRAGARNIAEVFVQLAQEQRGAAAARRLAW